MAKPGELIAWERLSNAAGVVTLLDEGDEDDDDPAVGNAVKAGGGQPWPASDNGGECGCALKWLESELAWSLAERDGKLPMPSPVAEVTSLEGDEPRM